MAARGWGYEVIFDYDILWNKHLQDDLEPFVANIARQMKCRVVGHEGMAQRAHIRLYVPSMAEIVQLRLLLNAEYIFRIYRLVDHPPTAADESNPSPDDPSVQS